jgi:hypothetical protein
MTGQHRATRQPRRKNIPWVILALFTLAIAAVLFAAAAVLIMGPEGG